MPETKDEKAVEPVKTASLPANVKDGPGRVLSGSEFDRFLTSEAAEMKEDDSDPLMRIVSQVMNAETPDAVLTPVDVLKAIDIVGMPFVCVDYRLEQSEYDVGAPFFAVMDVILGPDQPPQVVTCGHKKVLAQLTRLRQLNGFPFAAEFITRGTSKVGNTPMLELRKVDIETGEAG
jgi:hypothetical protein